MQQNKKLYYDIVSEFYNINEYRELKSIIYNGTNRLEHLSRVSKLSFFVSKKLNLDFISCTRGAMLHDFFTTKNVDKELLNNKYNLILDNSLNYFKLNDLEKNIILSHKQKESRVVKICDRIVKIYEFFRFSLRMKIYMHCIKFIKCYN